MADYFDPQTQQHIRGDLPFGWRIKPGTTNEIEKMPEEPVTEDLLSSVPLSSNVPSVNKGLQTPDTSADIAQQVGLGLSGSGTIFLTSPTGQSIEVPLNQRAQWESSGYTATLEGSKIAASKAIEQANALRKRKLETEAETEKGIIEEQETKELSRIGATLGAGAQFQGFSSAESGVIQSVRKFYSDKLTTLNKGLEEAKANLDISTLEATQKKLDSLDSWYQSRLNNLWNRIFEERKMTLAETESKQTVETAKFTQGLSLLNTQLSLPEGQTYQIPGTNRVIVGLKKDVAATAQEIFDKYGGELISLGITPDTPIDIAIKALQPILEIRNNAASQKDILELDKIRADIAQSKASTYKTYKDSEKADEVAVSDYQVERAKRTIENVDNLMAKISRSTVGYGSLFAGIPETEARNFRAELDTLKSNIAFGELVAMREASKTGGALGQVSDREGKLLESALGALDAGQSPENFRKNLQQIKESILRWQNEINKTIPSSQTSNITSGGVGYTIIP